MRAAYSSTENRKLPGKVDSALYTVLSTISSGTGRGVMLLVAPERPQCEPLQHSLPRTEPV